MVEIAEIAEECTLLGKAFEEIVSYGGVIALIFQHHHEYVVEMLRRLWVEGDAWGVLTKAETRNGPKTNGCTRHSAAHKRHVPSRAGSLAVFKIVIFKLRRQYTLKSCMESRVISVGYCQTLTPCYISAIIEI
jgi:hypothetical protein